MNAFRLACVAALAALSFAPARAESLRCNGHITEVGDSRVSLLYKCGEPLLRDSYCAPVYVAGGWQPVPAPLVGVAVPCLYVDEWLYDRGPGQLMVMVRIRAGVVQDIRYGRVPD